MHSVPDNTLLQHLRIYTSLCDAITVAAAHETLEYVTAIRETADTAGIDAMYLAVYGALERVVYNDD